MSLWYIQEESPESTNQLYVAGWLDYSVSYYSWRPKI
jgi:hypothetical protein